MQEPELLVRMVRLKVIKIYLESDVIFALGGYIDALGSTDYSKLHNNAETYNFNGWTAGKWTFVTSYPYEENIVGHQIISFNQYFLVIGGMAFSAQGMTRFKF